MGPAGRVRLGQASAALSLCGVSCFLPPCGYQIVQDSAAPGGGARAVVLEANYGAASSMMYDVCVLRPNQRARTACSPKRSAFRLNDVGRDASRGGGVPIRVSWLAADTVLVEYDQRVDAERGKVRARGVALVYRTW